MDELANALTGCYFLGQSDGAMVGAAWALRLVANGCSIGEAMLEIDAWLAYRLEIAESYYSVVERVQEQREETQWTK